ncbi:NrtA/SsuA/CpmA family ABC transporter substrate-binding protein [Peterkaempfera bronchialis]|uniref:ABC transporter substrate-binding protein n=1 Tax=Peterkaempfera bronchialis TaxID=2126346 RepID=A0A345SR95_9ACTN|nr:NrtA/SsuA/CpmA family ABC transporter substrate-binding protein [Peterkaempfera bronchialis]AXI76250.1 ABC transporter substrate-binding protein [Peterkaempfera bronchialis]
MTARTLRTTAALLSAAALLATAACGSSDPQVSAAGAGSAAEQVTLRVPDPGNSGPLALGKKDGSLAAALATVHAKVAWTGSAGPFAPAAQELNAGQLDVAQGSITSAITALSQKPGFKLFAATAPDKAGEGILVKDGSGIRTVKDLVGRKVAVSQGGTSEYLLLKALQQENIPVDRVKRVYLVANQAAPVFNSGQVDAWATWATFSVTALSGGAHFLADGAAVKSDNYAVWAVRTAFAEQHPEVVRAFYRYLHDAGAAELKSPEKYLNVFTDAGPEAVSGRRREITLDITRQGATVEPIREPEIERFDTVARFFLDQRVIPAPIDVRPHLIAADQVTGGGS